MIDEVLKAHELLRDGQLVPAQNFLLEVAGSGLKVKTHQEAYQGLLAFYYGLLNSGEYTLAAVLQWGDVVFNPRPRAVQRIWKVLNDPQESKVLIFGGSSQGKTVTSAAFADQYWCHDPSWTSVFLISTTAGHSRSGIMSKVKGFHRGAAIKLPGIISSDAIILGGESDRSASVQTIAIPEGDTGEGRLTGFHPLARPQPHPIFGALGRILVVVDEADVVPDGVWKGIDNILGNEDFAGSVKVVCLSNPRFKSNPFYFRAEPESGQITEDMEEWVSKEGWKVIRLDPATSENVVQRKSVFPGMMSYTGFLNFERKGKNDPSYRTYGRGLYPDSVAEFTVMSSSVFEDSVGRFTFIGGVTPIASIDWAFAEGADESVVTTGKYGTAIAFQPLGKPVIRFEDHPKKVIQVEQQFPVRKGNTQLMGADAVKILRSMGVKPEWVIADNTGNGRGGCDYLKWQYGSILAQGWGEGATEMKILQEDTETCDNRFRGIDTEMWFAFASWLEFGYLKFSPSMAGYRTVMTELLGRRWDFFQTKQDLEGKKTFKVRNQGKSPDHADSLVMLTHLIRVRAQQRVETLPSKIITPDYLWENDPSPADDQIPFVET